MHVSSDSLSAAARVLVQRPPEALRGRTLTHSDKSFKPPPSYDIKVHSSTCCIFPIHMIYLTYQGCLHNPYSHIHPIIAEN